MKKTIILKKAFHGFAEGTVVIIEKNVPYPSITITTPEDSYLPEGIEEGSMTTQELIRLFEGYEQSERT